VRVIRTHSEGAFANQAADFLTAHLQENSRSVLALPTGATPLALYKELIRRAALAPSCLAEARIFNLDEYCGVPPEHPGSFSAFLHRHLIEPLGLDLRRVRLLDGVAADFALECADYERAIGAAGGIDVCVLGLGENGHIAFNEPGSPWDLRTHVAELSPRTRARLERQGWEPRRIPTHGITLGIENVLDAQQVLLLIAGAGKLGAAAALYRGAEDAAWPVTCLLRHERATVIELCARSELP
jgi:glucosamine-6-phosphate deaminase